MNVKHSSATSEWYTPITILDRVHAVLGGIDVDPASTALANERVRATLWIGQDACGLSTTWCVAGRSQVRVFCNPPGGGYAVPFWERLMAHHAVGLIESAIFLAFNAELLQTSQGRHYPSIAAFPICAPSRRIRFDRNDGSPGPSPTHSSLIVYVGSDLNRFTAVFGDLGAIIVPHCPF